MSSPKENRWTKDLRSLVFQQALHGYLILSPDLVIQDVNDQYLRMTGTGREHLLGKHLFEAFPDNPDDSSADGTHNLGRSLEIVLATQQPHAMAVQKYDIPIRGDKNGAFEERYWQPINAPVLERGEVAAIIHHVEDVTQATINRRDEAIRLKLAAQFSDLAFCEFDHLTDTINVTRAFSALFGLEEQEGTVSAMPYIGRIHRDDVEDVLRVLHVPADAAVISPVHVDYRIVLPSGALRWLSTRSEIVHTPRNAAPRFVAVTLDITEAKEREAALDRAVQDRDRLLEQKELLLREVHHRIKNSLQLVTSILWLDAADAGATQVGQRLTKSAERVQAVGSVHELLYKADQVATVEFGAYLQELCASLESGWKRQKLGIEISCQSDNVRLRTDTAISLALLSNELISNARIHAFPGCDRGRISVVSTLSADYLELDVSDNGLGKPTAQGSGLGAKIIDGLVAQLEGDLVEEDVAPGYCVRVRIPLNR